MSCKIDREGKPVRHPGVQDIMEFYGYRIEPGGGCDNKTNTGEYSYGSIEAGSYEEFLEKIGVLPKETK